MRVGAIIQCKHHDGMTEVKSNEGGREGEGW